MEEEKNIQKDNKAKWHEKKHRRKLMYNKWIVKNIPFYFFKYGLRYARRAWRSNWFLWRTHLLNI